MTTAAKVADALRERGWVQRWVTGTSVRDDYGNIAHLSGDEETIRVEFEWAAPGGVVDVLHLCATRPASHIVAVVEALALPPEV